MRGIQYLFLSLFFSFPFFSAYTLGIVVDDVLIEDDLTLNCRVRGVTIAHLLEVREKGSTLRMTWYLRLADVKHPIVRYARRDPLSDNYLPHPKGESQ